MLTLGSLFDGIGGWLLAAQHAGIEPIWASEIAPFPASVTAHHFPNVVQLGDITKLDGAELPPVDIICAGSPCQNLSVAGNREGLNGAQSGLFRDAIRLVRDMRRASGGRYPRFFVWENVPGAFSSNKGLDFRAVLEEIGETEIPMPPNGRWAPEGVAELPKCEIAWRTLDAQWFGVPQRRRRIFLVADFTAGERCAGEILSERESVPRDSAAGGEVREGAAAGAESGAYIPSKARSLTARSDGSPCVDRGPKIIAAGFKAGQSRTGGLGYEVEKAATLMATHNGLEPTVAVYDMTHADEVMRKVPDGRAPTLNTVDRHAVAAFAETSFAAFRKDTVAGTQKESGGGMGGGSETLIYRKAVRRLTPTECERLMGLEDGYTLIDDKTCSDTARYKALGNGMAQPCADYVIRRIVEVTT